jgi:hypothetical protein
MQGRCAGGALSPADNCRYAVCIRASLSQVILHKLTKTGDCPRAQADTMLCLDSILFMWLKVVWMQDRKVTGVESSMG